ncbi:hypothetical protein VNO77_19055 [Canavalia gladiata]|uniref:Uncharacterized protein n=1 Tax=Canavalia gladiata TaxID=3824 RepID=A0AAN9LLT7_CANGL
MLGSLETALSMRPRNWKASNLPPRVDISGESFEEVAESFFFLNEQLSVFVFHQNVPLPLFRPQNQRGSSEKKNEFSRTLLTFLSPKETNPSLGIFCESLSIPTPNRGFLFIASFQGKSSSLLVLGLLANTRMELEVYSARKMPPQELLDVGQELYGSLLGLLQECAPLKRHLFHVWAVSRCLRARSSSVPPTGPLKLWLFAQWRRS